MCARAINPPKGYNTWLDYAKATMDTRSAQLEMAGLCLDDEVVDPLPGRDDMLAAAAAELAALRAAQ